MKSQLSKNGPVLATSSTPPILCSDGRPNEDEKGEGQYTQVASREKDQGVANYGVCIGFNQCAIGCSMLFTPLMDLTTNPNQLIRTKTLSPPLGIAATFYLVTNIKATDKL